jgi:hypothetical protein
MRTSTNSEGFKIELMKPGEAGAIRRFHLVPELVNLSEIEHVSAIYPVPYAGDEQPMIHVRRPLSKFMLEKPA